jgi:hypothetical protein
VNNNDFKIRVTLGARDAVDYWLDPRTSTPFQFPAGPNFASIFVPPDGNWKLFGGTVIIFEPGECRKYVFP